MNNNCNYHLTTCKPSYSILIEMNHKSLAYRLLQITSRRIVMIAGLSNRCKLLGIVDVIDQDNIVANKKQQSLSIMTCKYAGRQPQVWIVDMKVKL